MKAWIKTNLSKITLALALTGATTGTIGLIMGGMLTHENTKWKYFLSYNYEALFGTSIIWETRVANEHKIFLSFDVKSPTDYSKKWNGIYPDGYFNKKN